jgi:hypothetical protein
MNDVNVRASQCRQTARQETVYGTLLLVMTVWPARISVPLVGMQVFRAFNTNLKAALHPKKGHAALRVVHLQPPNLSPHALPGPFWGATLLSN